MERSYVNAAECQHRRPGHSSPTGTVEYGSSDNGELSLPARITPDGERQASEARRAVSDPGRDRTSEYR